MGKRFRWDMFFTSFLPLWVSIVVSDIWSIITKLILYMTGEVWFQASIEHTFDKLIELLLEVKIESISVLMLSIYIVISINHINSVIQREKHSQGKSKGTVKRARKANKLTSEFLLAYILPMFAFDFSNLKSIVLFLIYFGILSFLCIRNNNIYTNIFLEIKGYRMYDCDIECNVMNDLHLYTDSIIISKKDLTQTLPREIEYFDFENYIYIDIGD